MPGMRVLLLAQFYPPIVGGEERHVRNLAAELARRGHEVHVACLDVRRDPPLEDPGVTVHQLDNVGVRVPALYPKADRPLALPAPDPLVTRGLHRLVERLRPDVVHAHNWIVNSYLPLAAARRLPLLLSLHDYGHVCATRRLMFEGSPCSGPAPRKCLRCTTDWYGTGRGPVIAGLVAAGRPVRTRTVDLFTPVSSFVARANRLEEQGAAYRVVPNFVPDDLLGRDPDRDPALPQGDYLFFAGDLSAEKGAPTLVEAHARLDPATRPALVLVGNPTDPLPPLADDVTVGDKWAHERIVSAFRHSLAAVLPSRVPDSCPTTVLEAMALRAPLVTTPVGGITDMVVDEESALVVPSGDAGATSAAIARLVADADLRGRLADGGQVAVRGFLLSSVAAELEGLYEQLVRERRPAGATR